MFRPRFGSGSSTNGPNIWTGTNDFNFIRLNATDTFTNAVNTSGILFGTTSSAVGIEFLTATASNGSGFRIRATSANGLLIDARSSSASFTNYLTMTTAGVSSFKADVGIVSTSPSFSLTDTGSNIGIFRITAASLLQIGPGTSGMQVYVGRGGLSGADAYVLWDTSDNTIFYGSGGTERVRFPSGGGITIAEAGNIAVGTTTGTKIGTATTQKLGFWNATPVVQQTAVADASGGATIDAEARTALNAFLARARTMGLIAT